MHLKSEGFASNLYDPKPELPSRRTAPSTRFPMRTSVFRWTSRPSSATAGNSSGATCRNWRTSRSPPSSQSAEAFELTTATGETVRARRVVVAVGIVNFAHLPPNSRLDPRFDDLPQLPAQRPERIQGPESRGAGCRSVRPRHRGAALSTPAAKWSSSRGDQSIPFHDPPNEPRPLLQRLKCSALRSGHGLALAHVHRYSAGFPRNAAVVCASEWSHGTWDPPRAGSCATRSMDGYRCISEYHYRRRRSRSTDRPASCCSQPGREDRQLEVDHVIAATGYKAAVSRLSFIDQSLQARVRTAAEAPILNRHFESSVPGLYFVGAAAANSFGPLLRFAFGARFAAKRVASRLARN